jgi:L-alanine-DL-glutamate epimerase-like enolase superfamily enzyme
MALLSSENILETDMISVSAYSESWPYEKPFHITGRTWTSIDVVVADVRAHGAFGRGEAAGVYYRDETAPALAETLRSVKALSASAPRAALMELLPAGGARNALDCALWDLEAKVSRTPVWRLAGLDAVHPLQTTFTIGADAPEQVSATAQTLSGALSLKLKLNGDGADGERVRLARQARPDVTLAVDANQGFSRDTLDGLMGGLIDAGVCLIEQPFPVGQDFLLDKLDCPIPIAADESVCDIEDLDALVGRVAVINIKLDKCGGLTRALAMAGRARALGFKLMVGNMGGTSLAMAPAFVLGQLCDYVDLDGPTVLQSDRRPSVEYRDGVLYCPEEVWGAAVGAD